eukprot:scaffold456442_cov33-Prasinocladus_malaysianus.AAC.1
MAACPTIATALGTCSSALPYVRPTTHRHVVATRFGRNLPPRQQLDRCDFIDGHALWIWVRWRHHASLLM